MNKGTVVKQPTVSIVKTARSPGEKQIVEAVQGAAELGGIGDVIRPGQLVLIKPNFVAVPPGGKKGVVPLKETARALADAVIALGAAPVIADSAAAGIDTEEVIRETGFAQLRDEGYEVRDLKKEPPVEVEVPGGSLFEKIQTFELVKNADAIISLPVMKTHDQVEASLSIKNLKGLVPDTLKRDFHRIYNIYQAVPELVAAMKPVFAVVDGIYCQEGLGPIYGTPVEMDLILTGRDLVAVDSIAGQVMGIEENELYIEQNTADMGLGVIDRNSIKVVGGVVISTIQRKFKRAAEHVIIDEPTFNLIFEKGTCTGCRNTVLSSIYQMVEGKMHNHLKNKTVMAGKTGHIPSSKNIILVGACLSQLKGHGRYVKGCPPETRDVIEAIAGIKKK